MICGGGVVCVGEWVRGVWWRCEGGPSVCGCWDWEQAGRPGPTKWRLPGVRARLLLLVRPIEPTSRLVGADLRDDLVLDADTKQLAAFGVEEFLEKHEALTQLRSQPQTLYHVFGSHLLLFAELLAGDKLEHAISNMQAIARLYVALTKWVV
jgi:hypothetical protein